MSAEESRKQVERVIRQLREIPRENLNIGELAHEAADILERFHWFEMVVIGEGAWDRFRALEARIIGSWQSSDEHKRLMESLCRNIGASHD